VVKVDADEGLKELIREGLPEPIAKYLVGLMQETADGKDVWGALKEMHGEGVENVKKYTGHAALTFEEWAGRNKQMFV
jgi:hypothetical protein